MWELDHKEHRVLKNWCFQTVVLAKTCESPLDRKEIKPANLNGNQPWILIGRTDAEAPILWPPDINSWLTRKDLDAGTDWKQEKRATKDEMVGRHHWFNRRELGQTPGDSEVQRSLVGFSLWGHKESDMNWWLNNSNNTLILLKLFQKTAEEGKVPNSSSEGTIILIPNQTNRKRKLTGQYHW